MAASVQLDVQAPKPPTGAERGGALKSLTRYALVTGLTSTGSGQGAALIKEALGAAGMPAALSALSEDSNLILVNRNVEIITDSPNMAYVELEYMDISEAGYSWVFKGGTSLHALDTEKDLYGIPITTAHTYPVGDPYSRDGETHTHGAQVNVLYPQAVLSATGILSRDNPLKECIQWEGRLNSKTWAGLAAGRWIVMEVNFESHNRSASPKSYLFNFQFQAFPEGWNPSVVFIDEMINEPPAGIVEGVGTKTPTRYPSRDYNELFPLAY